MAQNRFWTTLASILGVLGILIGINMLVEGRLGRAQLDLTAGKLYTLSGGTKKVLGDLKDPITLRLYYSPALGAAVPTYGAFADRVRDLLGEYVRLSGGKLKLETYNPEPYTDVEDRAQAYGLQAVPLDANGEQVYFGLAGSNLLDDEKQIGFFKPDREPFLEYDLTRLVFELSNPKRPVVGLLSPLTIDGDPQQMMMAMRGQGQGGQPWISLLQLRQSFDVKKLEYDTQVIDPEIQVLVVAQPAGMSEATLYAIDQFVMRGGKLMLFVDPQSEMQAAQMAQMSQGMPPGPMPSDAAKLFDAWGIAYSPDQIVGDLGGAWRVRSPNASDRNAVVDYVAWISVRDGISRNDPATVDLRQITIATSGALAKKEGAAIEFTPLLSTTDQSALLPADKFRGGQPDPARILAEFKPEGGARVVAARVRGVLKSAFTGPPALPEGVNRADNLAPHRATSDGPANLVVVADSDVLADRFWVQVQNVMGSREVSPFADNGAFFSNVVGTLTGGDALLGLRSRGVSLRSFTLVDAMQRRAEQQFRQTQLGLQTHLDDVQKKLEGLRKGNGKGAQAAITQEQREAIDTARADIVQTRQKLRGVQAELRSDINTLQNELRLFCIALVPAVLTILAIILGVARNRRRARAHV